jgi:hypothetical protein
MPMSFNARRVSFRLVLGCAIVFSLCAAVQAQKIKVEYDKSLDFSQFKTFAWGHHDASSRPNLALAIAGAVQSDLERLGLKRVDENPDLYVQMYGAVDHDLSIAEANPLYVNGIPSIEEAYDLWYGISGRPSVVTVHKGQLVVDLISASQKKLVWRGVAKDKLSDKSSKLVEQVNRAVEKMFLQYPVKAQ